MPRLEPVVVDRAIEPFESRPAPVQPYRPDTVMDGWSTDRLTVRAASVRGYSHRYRGTPRQDDCAVAIDDHERVLIAVADGVSAAPQSHFGATIACRTAIEWLAAQDGTYAWDDLVQNAAWQLVEAVHRMGEEKDAAIAEKLLATTLLAAVIEPLDDGSVRSTLVAIGDSCAWVLKRGGFTQVCGGKTTTEGLTSSAVSGLPRVPAEIAATEVVLRPGDVLLLGTDGIGDPMGDGAGLVGKLFARELSKPPSLARFAYLLDFSRETFDDDRTLVAVWPRPLSQA